MGKIVNINENDLKRIVKRVLNERKQLIKEEPFTVLGLTLGTWGWIAGTAAVAGIGQEIYHWWQSGEPRERAGSLFQSCIRGGVNGKPIMDSSQHEDLAERYHEACPSKSWTVQCNEEDMVEILKDVESVPDLCGMIKEFNTQGYGNMWDITTSAIDTATWWEKINNALTPAVRKTSEANEQTKEKDDKISGGGEDGVPVDPNIGKTSTASGEGSVSDLQQLLKDKGFDVGSHGVDGKFGRDTLNAALKALRTLKSS